ncbi:hypothetical protein B0T26DRAFT_676042 [Lasiosphaeria miniovina]|uniref:SMP-30/Gluconolactonase/LRE-like region domain-containing protein n=1 Tax=Lasiosphaeria miniovina TaxID=1954250 RepID=A0AA40AL80_9PEZI|nr:uncharacterized protein B0T26DRAFT_676042 [Lasiosphaeria miniovina]KAK0717777.1 hypothetical protein B0T26DRAFT_676042 [Lasiosphaeria miniovina]
MPFSSKLSLGVLLSLTLASASQQVVAAAVLPPPVVSPVYLYSDDSFVENLHVLPSGSIIFTEVTSNTLKSIDPGARSPVPNDVISLPAVTSQLGITPVGPNAFAVAGGNYSSGAFLSGSATLFVVTLSGGGNARQPTGHVTKAIPVATQLMNGLASLPAHPHLVLAADSTGARVLRINTATGATDVVWADAAALGAPAGAELPLGVNGIRVQGAWLYLTNSARGFFGRVPIDAKGNVVGALHVIRALTGAIGLSNAYDDFAVDAAGNAYVALHHSSVVKITPAGVQTLIAGGEGVATVVAAPTAVQLSLDGCELFVTQAGNTTGTGGHGGLLKIRL